MLDLHVDADSIGCVDTLFAHSLLEDLISSASIPPIRQL
jgi:hypothetical protein